MSMKSARRWILLGVGLVFFVGACSDGKDEGPQATRHYTFQGIGGFSMGSMTAAILGMRHHEQFDIIAPLGGSIDLGLFLHVIKNELMAGFCEPPELGRMCPATPDAQTYEKMDVGPASQGGFRREGMFEAFQDMSIALGNPIMFNPEHPYLPPGVPVEYLEQSKEEACANPIRLEGFYDHKFNPDGAYPVITFCEHDGVERGIFDPDAIPRKPAEITLAVDINRNDRRDSGEPVLFQASERYDDFGEDGLANADEPGYDAANNPDPAGDDWHPMDKPFGTEGNHFWDEGEPYLDFGLDGVADTADSPYDWGEGNGHYDLNLNLMRAAVMYDPARMLKDLTPQQLGRLDFYIDVGIYDHLRFLDTCESFVGILRAKGRQVDIRDTFRSIIEPDWEGAWAIEHIDWPNIGRDLYLRYGHRDATAAQIAGGDGGHVGSYDQTLWRFFTTAVYASARWPDGDWEELTGDERGRLVDTTFYSEALDEDRQYYVLLPPGYDEYPDKRYPVMYLIHGIGMSASDMTASALFTPDWMKQGKMAKYIMVFPDGECHGECFDGNFFLNQQGRNEPPRRFEDSFFQDLIPHINDTYRTRPPEDIDVPAEYMAPYID